MKHFLIRFFNFFENIIGRLKLTYNLLLTFMKKNRVPLTWKILFMKSIFWKKAHFCNKFQKLLQVYNCGDYYNFDGLKVTFFPFTSNPKRTSAEYFIESFLIMIFPAIYGGEIFHPLSFIEANYFNDKSIIIDPKDIVFDCGGFIGHFTIVASKKAHHGKVFVFEPFKENIKLLLKNVNQNNLKNVIIIQKAVCKNNKNFTLNFNPNYPSASGIYNKTNIVEKRRIKCITLDQIYREYNLDKVDFIKMDIEGMERDALLGAKQIISKFKPKLSICTYHLPDDPIVLPKIIKNLRDDYKIKMKNGKLYAY